MKSSIERSETSSTNDVKSQKSDIFSNHESAKSKTSTMSKETRSIQFSNHTLQKNQQRENKRFKQKIRLYDQQTASKATDFTKERKLVNLLQDRNHTIEFKIEMNDQIRRSIQARRNRDTKSEDLK